MNHLLSVVGMAKLGVDFDASCIITHAYQPCPATLSSYATLHVCESNQIV